MVQFIMYFQHTKQKAVDLRKAGYSYNYIIQHVPVSKSTLSEWLRDIPFVPNKYTTETIGNARIASGRYRHQIKMDSFEKARVQSEKDISSISNRDIMMLGLGIYIGEGGKTHDITRIINSDPKIIKLMLKWFFVSFGIKIEQVKIRLHIYPDNVENKCIEYWSINTGIPKKHFLKSVVDERTDKKRSNQRKLPYGTAHVTVNSLGDKKHGVYLHRLIMAWIDQIFVLG